MHRKCDKQILLLLTNDDEYFACTAYIKILLRIVTRLDAKNLKNLKNFHFKWIIKLVGRQRRLQIIVRNQVNVSGMYLTEKNYLLPFVHYMRTESR